MVAIADAIAMARIGLAPSCEPLWFDLLMQTGPFSTITQTVMTSSWYTTCCTTSTNVILRSPFIPFSCRSRLQLSCFCGGRMTTPHRGMLMFSDGGETILLLFVRVSSSNVQHKSFNIDRSQNIFKYRKIHTTKKYQIRQGKMLARLILR